MVKKESDILVGMKAICQVVGNVSEDTVLKWHREADLPMRKKGGVWVGSRKRIEKWWEKFTAPEEEALNAGS